MTRMKRTQEIEKVLGDLHTSYLKGNEFDEGDLIFYRINYRLEEMFGLTRQEAVSAHEQYHQKKPRRMSEGFCDNCEQVTVIIPIIYGIQEQDIEKMKAAEAASRLIIGDMKKVIEGNKVAMFGCKVCKSPLPKYGML
jgi:hypothetical protein